MLADVGENLLEFREDVQLAAVRTAGREDRPRWFVFGALRPEPLERQQNRVAGVANKLEVLSAVAGLAFVGAASLVECSTILTSNQPRSHLSSPTAGATDLNLLWT